MKLLYCRECDDVVRLLDDERTCMCGATKGRYLDEKNAVFSGPAEPFAISNSQFAVAVQLRKEHGILPFGAWTTPIQAENFRSIDGTISVGAAGA